MPDPSGRQRLIFDLVQHEDAMFYQRANFSLVAESMILVAYSLLASRRGAPLVQDRVIATFGLMITIVWAYAAHRFLARFRYITRRAEDEYPYYRAIREGRPPVRFRLLGSTHLMAYVVPFVTMAMWMILLFV